MRFKKKSLPFHSIYFYIHFSFLTMRKIRIGMARWEEKSQGTCYLTQLLEEELKASLEDHFFPKTRSLCALGAVEFAGL